MRTSIAQTVQNGLCTGCGACAGLCPTEAIGLAWDGYGDRVAALNPQACIDCGLCAAVCPGANIDFQELGQTCDWQQPASLGTGLGSFRSLRILQNANPDSLARATSGGAVRRLAASLLEAKLVDAVLMVTERRTHLNVPFEAQWGVFTDPDEVLKHQIHSRYCPAPLLQALKTIRDDQRRFAVVGLPCHIHAIRKLQVIDQEWRKRIVFCLGLICSGTPQMNGHAYILGRTGIDPDHIRQIDYRCGAWPKAAYAIMDDGRRKIFRKMGGVRNQNWLFKMAGVVFMSPYFWRRRCLFCPDFFNNYADAAFGDPWLARYTKDLGGATLTIIRHPRLEELTRQLLATGQIRETLTDISALEIESSMGAFQRARLRPFAGYRRLGKFFDLGFPAYAHLEEPRARFSSFKALVNLSKARAARWRALWPLLEYLQFIEDGCDFLRRQLKTLWN